MADPTESMQDNFGNLEIVGEGSGLDGDAVGAALGADLDDDGSGDAEIEALEEEDANADEADVTASGAE